MKIVVLDGFAINPGDLDWSALEALGNLKVYDRSAPEEVTERCRDAEIVLTNKTRITGDLIGALPALRYIGELATGYDNIDIKTAGERGIPVCNVPGYSTPSVAQLTFALILELANHVSTRSDDVFAGGWVRSNDFCYGHAGLTELYGKTLALIGLGKIGTAVAKIGLAFGMRVIAAVRHPDNYHIDDIELVDIASCFAQGDFVSLHLPLTSQNKEMVNMKSLKTMKPTAYLINTARGGLINERDLTDALKGNVIAGAGLDVLSSEPPRLDNPLLGAPHCVITPHVAWATKESRLRLLHESAGNISGFLKNKLRNVVNGVGEVQDKLTREER